MFPGRVGRPSSAAGCMTNTMYVCIISMRHISDIEIIIISICLLPILLRGRPRGRSRRPCRRHYEYNVCMHVSLVCVISMLSMLSKSPLQAYACYRYCCAVSGKASFSQLCSQVEPGAQPASSSDDPPRQQDA